MSGKAVERIVDTIRPVTAAAAGVLLLSLLALPVRAHADCTAPAAGGRVGRSFPK